MPANLLLSHVAGRGRQPTECWTAFERVFPSGHMYAKTATAVKSWLNEKINWYFVCVSIFVTHTDRTETKLSCGALGVAFQRYPLFFPRVL